MHGRLLIHNTAVFLFGAHTCFEPSGAHACSLHPGLLGLSRWSMPRLCSPGPELRSCPALCVALCSCCAGHSTVCITHVSTPFQREQGALPLIAPNGKPGLSTALGPCWVPCCFWCVAFVGAGEGSAGSNGS